MHHALDRTNRTGHTGLTKSHRPNIIDQIGSAKNARSSRTGQTGSVTCHQRWGLRQLLRGGSSVLGMQSPPWSVAAPAGRSPLLQGMYTVIRLSQKRKENTEFRKTNVAPCDSNVRKYGHRCCSHCSYACWKCNPGQQREILDDQ